MWGFEHYPGYETYESFDYDYDEGYAEEGEDYVETTAPHCWNGSSCPFLASGTCQYYHSPEDIVLSTLIEEEAEEAERAVEASTPDPKTAPAPVAAPCARMSGPWNVLVVPADATVTPTKDEHGPLAAAVESPGKAKEEPRARLRSRSARRKAVGGQDSPNRLGRKDDLLVKARTVLAELRAKQAKKTSSDLLQNSAAAMKGA